MLVGLVREVVSVHPHGFEGDEEQQRSTFCQLLKHFLQAIERIGNVLQGMVTDHDIKSTTRILKAGDKLDAILLADLPSVITEVEANSLATTDMTEIQPCADPILQNSIVRLDEWLQLAGALLRDDLLSEAVFAMNTGVIGMPVLPLIPLDDD